MKKYILTDEKKEVFGRILYRIQAVRSFGNVKEGEKGGWIEKEGNLSHDGDSWVYENALIYENAQVHGNAQIHEHAQVHGHAQVHENALVFGDARIFGDAQIHGDTKIHENAWIYGHAQVSEKARVFGDARIFFSAVVEKTQDFICFSSIGSRFDSATFYKNKNGGIFVSCGCFGGTIEEFQNQVAKTHGSNKFAKEYDLAIELAKIHILEEKK